MAVCDLPKVEARVRFPYPAQINFGTGQGQDAGSPSADGSLARSLKLFIRESFYYQEDFLAGLVALSPKKRENY